MRDGQRELAENDCTGNWASDGSACTEKGYSVTWEKENGRAHYMTDGNRFVEFKQYCVAAMHKALRSPGTSFQEYYFKNS